MNLWLGATATVAIAIAGVLIGKFCSRLTKFYWTLGYFIPLAIIAVYAIAILFPAISFIPPFSWMMMGQKRYAILGFIVALVFTLPLSRLPLKRERIAVSVLMSTIILIMAVWPFLAPAFNRNRLEHLHTHFDSDGVCLQSTYYTCGPAAAVTALHKLGFEAEEGQLAIQSLTSSLTGTQSDILAEALRRQYGKNGLSVEYRQFENISELKDAGLIVATVKFGFMVNHFVTVIKVTDSQVIVGNPINGLQKLSYDEFQQEWLFMGIVLKRKS